MKTCIGTFFLALLFVSCHRENSNHWKNTLFVFYQSTDSSLCNADERTDENCKKGNIFLTSEGKALYFFHCMRNDSTKYYRGTYRVTDSVVYCIFDSRLDRGKDPQKERLHFRDITQQTVTLRPTGCEAGKPQLFTADLHYYYDTSKTQVFTYLAKADLQAYSEFCKSVSMKPSLVDFVCQSGGDTAYQTLKDIDVHLINRIIDYYAVKNPRSQMRRVESDSAIDLSFSFLKRKRRDDLSPYLYVTIPKSRNSYIFGDLNSDGEGDIVAAPRSTEGGSSYWQDIFVFIGSGETYELLPVVSAMDIARCTRNSYNGAFVPRQIKEGVLIGTTTCFTDDDAACCPSVKMETKYVLENKKLKILKKEKGK